MMLVGTEVKRSFAAFGETIFIALPLIKQLYERHVARGEYTEVTIDWENSARVLGREELGMSF